jgi:tetratricopeptide (TPR) repeat protein
VGLDVGASLWLLRHAKIGNHRVGLFMQNLLAPQPGADAQALYARQLKVALNSELFTQRLTNALELNLSDLMAHPELFVNDSRAIEWNLAMATTYWLFPLCGVTVLSGFNQEGFEHWGMALGLRIPLAKAQRHTSLGYQLRDESQTILPPSHSLYARIELGESRLQRHEERMRKRISLRPNELYQQAMELFAQQKYWESFLLLSRIEREFPDFFKADAISFYRAKCLQHLDVQQLSAELYTQTKLRYPKSALLPQVDLGLMSIHYNQRNFAELFRDYINLNMPGVSDSLRYHGAYLMGQALMAQGRYREALVPLNKLTSDHPVYVFARYSAAISHLRLQQSDSALVALHEAVNAPAPTPSQQEMQSRSYLMTGLFFYEQNMMAKAMTALQKVPPTSLFYPEALLGQGWCAVKVQQWGDCFDIGRELQRVGRTTAERLEGMLFEGVSLLARKRHAEAAKVLTDAQLVDTTGAELSSQTLKVRRSDNSANRMDYEENVRRINTVALQTAPQLSPVQIDSSIASLRMQQTQLSDFLDFEAALQTKQGFWRPLAEVRPDIDYYQALANKQGAQKKSMAVQRELVKEQRDIDKEIESLERQMQELEKP